MATEDIANKRWFPLEANPEVMNKYVASLGMKGAYAFNDVYGIDPDLLGMVPKPVIAVLLLFPITAATEEASRVQAETIDQAGQVVSDQIYFVKQTIGNACGTMGLIHAVCNNLDKLSLTDDGFFKQFYEETKGMTELDRAAALERNDQIEAAHEESAAEGQSEVPDADEPVNLHFICFVQKDGHLYELDGRKKFPINHGSSSEDTLLEDAAKVIQEKFMAVDPEELNFNMVALCKADEQADD